MRVLLAATVLIATTALPVFWAPSATAACADVPPGSPLPTGASEDPVIERLGLREAWELSQGINRKKK